MHIWLSAASITDPVFIPFLLIPDYISEKNWLTDSLPNKDQHHNVIIIIYCDKGHMATAAS